MVTRGGDLLISSLMPCMTMFLRTRSSSQVGDNVSSITCVVLLPSHTNIIANGSDKPELSKPNIKYNINF